MHNVARSKGGFRVSMLRDLDRVTARQNQIFPAREMSNGHLEMLIGGLPDRGHCQAPESWDHRL